MSAERDCEATVAGGTRPLRGDVTLLLQRWAKGDESAGRALWPLVYEELRRVATLHLRRERAGHTLEPTALVHEAWLRLGAEAARDKDRGQFLCYASRAMRSLLVDYARRHQAKKRGGDHTRITLREELDPAPGDPIEVLELNDALERLGEVDGELGRIAELRLFGGLSQQEVAQATGNSLRTVERRWRVANTWLQRELGR